MINCIDNSGAALVECIQIVGQKRHASIGMFLSHPSDSIPLPQSKALTATNR